MLIDTHAHLDDESFDAIRGEVVDRAQAAGVSKMICVGTTLAASEKCVRLADEYPAMYAAVGIQPNYVSQAEQGDWDSIVALAKSGSRKIVALGETGLDRYWDYAPFDLQQDYFDRHLRLSQSLELPFIVHMRDCGDDIVAMLTEARSRGPLLGVMHSFTGEKSLAKECLELGMYISFAGMATFKKSHDLRAVAATIPSDRILVETDAPYLSPHPKRGQRPNEPALMVHTAECLAKARGETIEAFAANSTKNAQALFNRL